MNMVSKITLINWMYFQKTTLPLNGNAAIIGENGSGKSTIIDAIQMLLLGQKASKFNANADAEKRSLESYIRGRVNTEDKEYLRPGDVISYLALQIDTTNGPRVFGIYFDYKLALSRLSDPKYFYLEGVELNNELFIRDNYPKTYDVFVKEMKTLDAYMSFQTLGGYQTKIKEVFGLKSDNYFKILSRAVGIKNITDCNKFMTNFILDDTPIDLKGIKDNIYNMEKITETIEKQKEKENDLSDIVDLGNGIINDNQLQEKNRIKLNLLKQKKIKNDIITANNTIDKLKVEIDLKQSNKKLLEEKKEGVNLSIVKLNAAINNISPGLDLKQSELKRITKEYDNVHLNLNTFIENCRNNRSNVSNLKFLKEPKVLEFENYLRNEEFESIKTKELFNQYRNVLNSRKSTYEKNAEKLDRKKDDYVSKLKEMKKIIEDLKKNQFTYDSRIESFRNELKSVLKDKYHDDIEVKFLCEYLDITDESWRNALEGYLGTQRFHIIVDNKYYKDAITLFHQKKDLFITKIVNSNKLPDFEYQEGCLGSLIKANNQIALNYARYLLNRVHCVDTIYKTDEYDIAITKDCMTYQNYAFGRINPKNYQRQYIGANALKLQLMNLEKEFEDISQEYKNILDELYSINKKMGLIENQISFASNVLENNQYIESINQDVNLSNQIDTLKSEIDFYLKNPLHIEKQIKLNEMEKDLKITKSNIRTIDDNIIDLTSKVKTNLDAIEERNKTLASFVEESIHFDSIILSEVEDSLETIQPTANSISKIEKEINNIQIEISKKIVRIESLMTNSRNKYSINTEPKMENLLVFKNEYDKINRSVFEFQEKLISMQENNRKLFFSNFLTKLYSQVENAKKSITDLNYSLAAFTFGNDKYKTKLEITDNQDFKDIYEYAKEYSSEDSDRGIFVNRDVEDAKRTRIQNILNEYMFSSDKGIQDSIVDYRQYLNFDVLVEGRNGVKSLNATMRNSSGGEVQVPFYILTGVAFKQNIDYRRNKDALGMVLYDEVFDKMDTPRIEAMLQFYREKLQLQVILASPGKLDSIATNINTILVVVRDGENAIVSDVSHELQ